MKNIVKVTIAGKEYNLTSQDAPEYTRNLAAQIDSTITSAVKNSTGLSGFDAAILCSMDLLDELTKANQNIENIRSQIKDYVDDAGKARLQADDAQKELRTLRAKVLELEQELALRTTIIKDEPEEVMNANDIISQEIADVLNSPVHSSEPKPASNYVGAVDYRPADKK